MKDKLYRLFAQALNARKNCIKSAERAATEEEGARLDEMVDNWDWVIEELNNLLPSGSGFDVGSKVLPDSQPLSGALRIDTAFHFMNDGGYYDGWEEYVVRVKPSLLYGIELAIAGRDRNDIKDYMYETFQHSLTREYELPNWKERKK